MHKCAQAEGNKIDHWCFACGNLKETVNHMLQCKSNQWVAAKAKALQDFCKHLSQYHTPAPMADHHMPRRLVQWKATHNNPPSYQPWRSLCNPAPTHQQSLPQTMHYQMGPFPLRSHRQDMETSHCTLLLWTTTGHPFQPSTLGLQDSQPSVDYIRSNLAMPKWRSLWQRLWWTMHNSTTNYKTISEANLWTVEGTSIQNRLQHPTCATDQGSNAVDKMPPRCIPHNSQSLPGTECRPQLIDSSPCITTHMVAVAGRCMVGR
jgi:hypothetical protein